MKDIKQTIKNSDYFIISEIGMIHDGSYGNALNLIKEAKNCCVNAIKFQLHISEEEMVYNALNPPYFNLESRWDYFNRTAFTVDQWINLRNYAHELGLYFIISPFSHKAVDWCVEIKVDFIKVASGETTNLPLLKYINSKKIPILLSTGMSNWEEIFEAVEILKDNLLVIFQCSSQYPCKPKNVGLNVISAMNDMFKKFIIGFSDHTLNNVAMLGAYFVGAKVFEKHFTLSNRMYGSDAQFSYEPWELTKYVYDLKQISIIMNNFVDKDNIEKYKEMKDIFEKKIVASKDLTKGTILTLTDLLYKKTGNEGIKANKYKEVIGKKINKNIQKDKEINWKDLFDKNNKLYNPSPRTCGMGYLDESR